jgi:hypothetical protein
MDNGIVVYRSRREQLADQFWMSDDGQDALMVILLIMVTFGLAIVIGEQVKRRRIRQGTRWPRYW